MRTQREGTEFYCHWCDGYIRVVLDLSVTGNHCVMCPKCGHEHYRVVVNGEVTSDRWNSSFSTSAVTCSMANYYTTSAYSSTTSSAMFAQSWLNVTSA